MQSGYNPTCDKNKMSEIKIKKSYLKYGVIAIAIVVTFLLFISFFNSQEIIGTKIELTQDDIEMIEHCRMMPEMPGCNEYLALAEEKEVAQEIKNDKFDRS